MAMKLFNSSKNSLTVLAFYFSTAVTNHNINRSLKRRFLFKKQRSFKLSLASDSHNFLTVETAIYFIHSFVLKLYRLIFSLIAAILKRSICRRWRMNFWTLIKNCTCIKCLIQNIKEFLKIKAMCQVCFTQQSFNFKKFISPEKAQNIEKTNLYKF